MSDGPQTFPELLEKVGELADQVCEELADKANETADKLQDAVNSVLNKLAGLWPGESDAEKAWDKWCNEIQPNIQEQIYKVRDEVQKAVDELAGNPLDLLAYSDAWIAAKADLYKRNTLEQDIAALGNTWEGDAYASYASVASSQSDALLALANSMQTGGQLTADGANKILSLWADLVNNFLHFQADAVSNIGSYADIGKALGGWISAIADSFAVIWGAIADLADVLVKFWIDQVSSFSKNWDVLATGTDGLPENKWPIITENTSDTMNNPGSWPGAA